MIIINIIFSVVIFYLIYQLVRNEAVYKMRAKWINSDDLRWHKYTYDEIMNPNKENWCGIKFPKDKDFK